MMSTLSSVSTVKGTTTHKHSTTDALVLKIQSGMSTKMATDPWSNTMVGIGCEDMKLGYLEEWAWYFTTVRQ